MSTELVPLHVDDVSLPPVATTRRVGNVKTTLNNVMVKHIVKVFLVHHLITVEVLVIFVVQGWLHARELITILHTEIAIVAVLSPAAFVVIVIVVGVVVVVVMAVVIFIVPGLLVVLLVDHFLILIL